MFEGHVQACEYMYALTRHVLRQASLQNSEADNVLTRILRPENVQKLYMLALKKRENRYLVRVSVSEGRHVHICIPPWLLGMARQARAHMHSPMASWDGVASAHLDSLVCDVLEATAGDNMLKRAWSKLVHT